MTHSSASITLLSKGLHAFKWSLLGEVSARLITPLAFLVLAWKLTPADFGVAAAATILISFSQVVWDSGLSRVLVPQRTRLEAAAAVVFWVNLASALVLAAVLFAIADSIGKFFGNANVAQALRVLVLVLPLSAAASVQVALRQRELAFRSLFWARLWPSLLAPLLSVLLAWCGLGYWALVVSAVVAQAAQTWLLWRGAAWWPPLSPRAFDTALASELWVFGRWSLLAGFLGWCFGWLDALIVGHVLGGSDLGLFRSGNTLATMAFGVLFGPLMPVAYSLFSRVGDDRARLREGLLFMTRAAALVGLPLAAWLFVASDAISALLFPLSWHGIGMVVAWMALVQGVSWIVGYNGEAYRAIGRPALESVVAAVLLLAYLIGLWWAAHQGLLTFLQVRFGIAAVAMLLHTAVAGRALGLPWAGWLRAVSVPAVLAGTAAVALDVALTVWGGKPWPLVVATSLAALGYGGGVLVAERTHVAQWRSLWAARRA